MLENEQILTFTEAARALPRINGKRLHPSTIWRWARRGVGGVQLEAGRLGARFFTSRQALDRFAAALAAIEPSRGAAHTEARPSRSTSQREREIKKAVADCDKAGI